MDADLAQQTIATVPLFTLKGQSHWAKCVKCYDADTIHIIIKFHGEFVRFRCRLAGIDTAEVRSADDTEKRHAIAARDWVRHTILGGIVLVQCREFDKYGRLLVDVHVPDREEDGGEPIDRCYHLNTRLVERGYAYAYTGGSRRAFAEWYAPQQLRHHII